MSAIDIAYHVAAGTSPWTIVPLHATGGDEHQLVPLAHHLAPGAAVIAPRGTVMEDGHIRRFFRRRSMADLDIDDLKERADELAVSLRGQLAEHRRDPRRVIAVGYSNGANIAVALLLRHPGLLAGAVLLRPMLPYTPESNPDLAGVSVLVAAGEGDPYSSPEMTAALTGLLRDSGAAVEMSLEPGGHQIGQGDVDGAAKWVAGLTAEDGPVS
jgi:predicted esterase